jgi:DNA repair protein RecN (Recombination protein N)
MGKAWNSQLITRHHHSSLVGMIHHLYIRNYAVIDELDLDFGPGLNLLTGETGSGKSVIVDAIGIALGERTDSDAVRTGADKAVVEAVIGVEDSPEVLRILDDAGISPEDGRIMVSREVQATGKSQCRINGRVSTVSLLKEITDHLVDTHGQHEHQFLLHSERHIDVLDAWCGPEADTRREQVAAGYSELRRLQAELKQLKDDERDRARMLDLYQFQADEIAAAKLTPGEEDELLADRTRLAGAEKLSAGASAAFELLGERSGEGCALDGLREAVGTLQSIGDLDDRLGPMVESLQSALYNIEDAVRELRSYRDGIEFNPERLSDVEERLDLIRNLKRKYGESIEEILKYGESLQSKLQTLTNSEDRALELESAIESASHEAISAAESLSELRRQGGQTFANAVVRELTGLNMPHAVFECRQERKDLDYSGIDRVEFLISANPGEPPRPLARIASGGEMSRIMLAIKSATAAVASIPTMVFDEIDVGVGGRTAEVIGERLANLAKGSQVLCITHLPQIASLSGNHFCIEKRLLEDRTVVRVRQLSDEERVAELSRMLGGAKPSDTAVLHAREMLGIEEEHFELKP